jgi:hypothetical protein
MIYPVYVIIGKRHVLLTIAKTYRQAVAVKSRFTETSYKKILIYSEVA